jgi:hypothetical protein
MSLEKYSMLTINPWFSIPHSKHHTPILVTWPMNMALIQNHEYHGLTYGAGHLQLRCIPIIEIQILPSDTIF